MKEGFTCEEDESAKEVEPVEDEDEVSSHFVDVSLIVSEDRTKPSLELTVVVSEEEDDCAEESESDTEEEDEFCKFSDDVEDHSGSVVQEVMRSAPRSKRFILSISRVCVCR
jgi:hypothetical protein